MYEEHEREAWEALRDALADRYDMADLECCTLAQLESFYADIQLEEFLAEEYPQFQKQSILTQEQLLDRIRHCRADFQKKAACGSKEHSDAFYQTLDRLLGMFYSQCARATLPEPLPKWWFYSYAITSTGIRLQLNHLDWSCCAGFDCVRDERFTLVETPATLLTVSEFARQYGIEVVTVRQWIRRGKIRSAIKNGKEWRIPELAELRKNRGYTPCRYNWTSQLTDLPEKFSWLDQFESARFWQDCEKKNQFRVALDARKKDPSEFQSWKELEQKRLEVLGVVPGLCLDEAGNLLLTGQEREELELYLIASPLVHYGPKFPESSDSYQIAEYGADYCSNMLSTFIQE